LTRIFSALASFAILMLIVTLLLGLYVGDLHQPHSKSTGDVGMVHRLFGIATALVVVLVNSIVMTYFIGTSRWCREVVETYQLNPALVARSAVLKRRAFPWASAATLVVIGISALGAAADPATQRAGTANWVIPHLIAALAGLIFIAWAFFQQGQRIAEHHVVITEILAEVAKIRKERGLATSD
jgi:Na+/serine symporter